MAVHFRTRFAPSPTGYLHLGHAYSALAAYHTAKEAGGEMLLRIEDIDSTRCRPEFVDTIFEDLQWLGLNWPEAVRYQSAHLIDYKQHLETLSALGLTYPCFCTRSEIKAAGGQVAGPDGPLYPGTCKALPAAQVAQKIENGLRPAIRLHMDKAIGHIAKPLCFEANAKTVTADPAMFGDVVLARKDIGTSYHLAVVNDDADQDITHVIRGEDLRAADHLHVLLQALLGLPAPVYLHHPLVMETNDKKLSKSSGATALRSLRAAGTKAQDIADDFHRWRATWSQAIS